ncbi:glycoside hydrolase family 3 C-terminal domain-containing protein [Paenibacillus macerans]|uniref:glycoside hydrolase family 3 C-terminal domain-containing protein n=1 Tax=Paenibacillus macerans TaxID=44252 RepID=UPI003D32149E
MSTPANPHFEKAYLDPELPIPERVSALLAEMTLPEKVRQLDQYYGASLLSAAHPRMSTVMADEAEILWDKVRETFGKEGIGCIHDLYGTPEINNALQRYAVEETRLGIPILFSEEALHGLLRPGCTIYPQAISMASTWNPELVRRVGEEIAAEVRSFGIQETFGPVLDLAREPRWGRVEETFGEDTHLAARMAVSMVRGLQGDNLAGSASVVAEPKHFAVHGIPESGLNHAPCSIGAHEMHTYHLPVFEAAFTEGGAVNAMCAYNSIDGVPCAADTNLLTEVLRGQWRMPGFVRSDLGAIARLQNAHHTAGSEREAIRQALMAGTDMQYYDFPHETYQNAIADMVREGVIPPDVLDTAVGRVLTVKFLLGLFENPYTDPNRRGLVVRSRKHADTALQTARESLCLLRNENGLLPLPKNLGKIAVIGPSADEARLGDYSPAVEGFKPVTVLQGIRQAVSPETEVSYTKGCGILEDELEPIPVACLNDGDGNPGLRGEYFNNPNLAGKPALTRTDAAIAFDWAITKPDQRIQSSGFSVRWTGKLIPPHDVSGRIGIASQDSMRLWLDGRLAVDGWGQGKSANGSVEVELKAGRAYELRVEYCKDTNGVEVLLGWSHGEDGSRAVELAREADVAIVALGDSRRTCGEGVDRSELGLPGRQGELLRALYATGTPIVLVLQNGRPLTLEWESAHIPAILEAWYPGEQGGTAIAETLFGDCNPAGRLPVSFPKTVGQLPVYYNRRRGGQPHYVEGDNRPLYAFGHGLSYTAFAYADLRVHAGRIRRDETLTVSLTVSNVGSRAGDEVVQLYLSDLVSQVVRPDKELKAFRRIHLLPGESAELEFELTPRELSLLDRHLCRGVEPGVFRVVAGPGSDRIALSAEFEVIE